MASSFPLRWPCRAGCRGGASTQLTTTPQVRRQMPGTRKAARLSRRATRPREIEQSERTCRPTAARPPYGRIDLLRRRGPNPRSCVRLRRRGGVTTRGARLLGRLVSAEWIVPLRHWRAAAFWYGAFTPLLQPAAVVCVLVLRSRRGRDWAGLRAGSSRPPGCVSRGCSTRWGYRCGSSRRRRARRSSCSPPPSSAPPPRIARRRAWPPS